jgi:tRNA(Ile)-lysidine synthase
MMDRQMSIECRFLEAIDRHGMVRRGERVLVAVSGGSDSVALLMLLHEAAPRLGITLRVAHLDHGWRGRAAERDAAFVERLARRLRIPCTVGHADPEAAPVREPGERRQSSREARARAERLTFLRRAASAAGASRIALGHTMDDQAESFLLRLLRGSGARGLSGTWPVVDGLFIRPLLGLRRRDLRAWLAARGGRWREDATNRDLSFARNRVRRRLIPFLEREFSPAAVDLIARAADLLRAEESLLSTMAQGTYDWVARKGPDGVALPAESLASLPLPFRRRLVRLAIRDSRGHLRGITARHVEAVLTLTHGPGAAALDLPGGLRATRRGGTLVFRAGATAAAAPFRRRPAAATAAVAAAPLPAEAPAVREALCPVPGAVSLDSLDLRLHARIVPRDRLSVAPGPLLACLDADMTPGPLLVRTRRPGDRFRPLGGPGSRKIKSFLIDRKVPADERRRIPLVLSGDRIAWVVGHQIDDRFKMTPATRRVLVLEKEAR